MKRKPIRWSSILKRLFSPVRRKSIPTKLAVERLDERIVPSGGSYSPNPLAADGATGSLRADITLANNDTTSKTETFTLQAGATYTLTIANPQTGHELSNAAGDLNIQNFHGTGTKTYIFNGNGATIDQTVADRVFEIVGSNAVVEFNNLIITGGNAQDNGAAGEIPGSVNSWGGGILNEGANLILSGCTIVDNNADAFIGLAGTNGGNANKAGEEPGLGGLGASGASAYGGGIYSTAGTITLNTTTISNNEALGGNGGAGGKGGNVTGTAAGSAASGGLGGNGGDAFGGGIYMASGNLVMSTSSKLEDNTAVAGVGGAGGAGGKEGDKSTMDHGGLGGEGGVGGSAEAGGIYSALGTVTLNGAVVLTGNKAEGGAGGAGGAGGSGTGSFNIGGVGGVGGVGGAATAGGIYAKLGNVTIESISTVDQNAALAGEGGAGGAGGRGDAKNKTSGGTGGDGAVGGAGGAAFGGGVYAVNGLVLIEYSSAVNSNTVAAGAGGIGGGGGSGKQHFGGNGGDGGIGGDFAQGGGVYSALGVVTIEQASSVNNNVVKAAPGGSGGVGGSVATQNAVAGNGGNGGTGGSATGGGIYAQSGTVMVIPDPNAGTSTDKLASKKVGSEVDSNHVTGVNGGNGGVGGKVTVKDGSAGVGGNGGVGESFSAGGIYAGNGSVDVTSSFVKANEVGFLSTKTSLLGISGGKGGNGGAASATAAKGGKAGNGSVGGNGLGGGIYAVKGTVMINDSSVFENEVRAGTGGAGGTGGHAENASAGIGGAAGAGGLAAGGGVYGIAGQILIESTSILTTNLIYGGAGGVGGPGGLNNPGQQYHGGAGGAGGFAEGGAIWSSAAAVEVSGVVKTNGAFGGNGGIGGTGGGVGGAGGNGEGGGIFGASGSITIQDHAKVEVNYASGGSGGSGANNYNIRDHGAKGGAGGSGQGGGIYSEIGNVSVNLSLVSSNVAAGKKGGVGAAGYGASGGTSSTAVSGSTSSEGGKGGVGGNADGGGIYLGYGNLNLEHANVQKNIAGGDLAGGAGGGVRTSASSAIGGNGGNGGDADGGGIFASVGAVSLTVQDSSVTSNTAGPGGRPGTGGAGNGKAGLGGNVLGGGIYTAANSLILDSTVAYNTAGLPGTGATSLGGGVYIAILPSGNTSGTTISNATIAFNNSYVAGGGIGNGGKLSLASTLVAENTSTTTDESDFQDVGTTLANYSLIQTAAGNTVTNGVNNDIVGVTTSALDLNPTLQTAPSTNGTEYIDFTGPSVALKAGSNPDNLTTDQIGNKRTVGGSTDIGAIENGTSVSGTPLLLAAGKNGFVEIINASTHAIIQNFQPFGGYTGVVSVALGDVNADGVPDIITSAKGIVRVYDGASAVVPGVNFGVPSTWTTRLVAANGRTTPILYQFGGIPGYTGALNIASGDVNGDGYSDIVVGTQPGFPGRAAVYSGVNGTIIGGILSPFGTSFTGGITVAAGDVTGDGPAEVILGTQTKGDQVMVYQLQGSTYSQLGNTIVAFGSLPAAAQLQVTAVDVDGTGVDGIAIGVLSGGVGRVDLYDESDATGVYQAGFVSNINVGGGLTAMAISAYNATGSGADSLLIATVPAGSAQFHILNPTTGDPISTFNELPALTGGISIAGT